MSQSAGLSAPAAGTASNRARNVTLGLLTITYFLSYMDRQILAILLEEGDLGDALERLRRAQERLSEAMKNGASDQEIAELMQELREATGYRLPVSVKLGAGRVRDDIKIAVKDGFDFVELDGMQGATGAGSAEVIDFVGIPTLPAIVEALEALEEIGRRQDIQLVLMGGLRDGIDAVKALCLGADAAAFGTSVLIAGGCIACMQCHVGQCVTGIATQDRDHEHRYKPETEARNIHRFLEGVRWQIAAVTYALGYRDVKDLSRDDLVALTPEAAEITGLSFEPDQAYRPVRPAIAQGKV